MLLEKYSRHLQKLATYSLLRLSILWQRGSNLEFSMCIMVVERVWKIFSSLILVPKEVSLLLREIRINLMTWKQVFSDHHLHCFSLDDRLNYFLRDLLADGVILCILWVIRNNIHATYVIDYSVKVDCRTDGDELFNRTHKLFLTSWHKLWIIWWNYSWL